MAKAVVENITPMESWVVYGKPEVNGDAAGSDVETRRDRGIRRRTVEVVDGSLKSRVEDKRWK